MEKWPEMKPWEGSTGATLSRIIYSRLRKNRHTGILDSLLGPFFENDFGEGHTGGTEVYHRLWYFG